jgi:hypothetical protein
VELKKLKNGVPEGGIVVVEEVVAEVDVAGVLFSISGD